MRNPTILIADDEPANRLFARRVLEAARWTVVDAADGAEAVARAAETRPHVIMMDIDMPGVDGWAATAAIRAGRRPLSSVPILAYTALRLDDAAIAAGGLDGRLPKPSAPEALVAAVARWRPDGERDRVARLSAVFGQVEMTQLIVRFRDQLVDAVAALDHGDDGHAHRIAGVAGTLGFTDVSESWLRWSEGDATARDDARRTARLALAGIDRAASGTQPERLDEPDVAGDRRPRDGSARN